MVCSLYFLLNKVFAISCTSESAITAIFYCGNIYFVNTNSVSRKDPTRERQLKSNEILLVLIIPKFNFTENLRDSE